MTEPVLRQRPPGDARGLPDDLHPVLRRVYAARGVRADALSLALTDLLPPSDLLGIDTAAACVADAIQAGEGIVISGDYDADGATGTTVGVSGLRLLGALRVDYVVPDRFRMGYGLSPALAELAAQTGARLLITVDSGISSVAGVARARALGLRVIITDHHLPGPQLPVADAIVNPNQPGCTFASKALAGVGAMFYLLLATRAELRSRGLYESTTAPNLAELLDLVALGTVADVVPLDRNNRILVEQGLRRIRAGRARPGIAALLAVAGRDPQRITASDLGFALGPRINAAGRLDDIRMGIECLLATDPVAARESAQLLDRLNRERRDIQTQMHDDALELLDTVDAAAVGITLFHPDWHEGVVGLVASKVKEQRHRPVVAFAPAQTPGELKGSARSVPGLHLRDVLAAIDAQHPGLIPRFGGHAMAAGLSLSLDQLDAFEHAFDAECRRHLSQADLEQIIHTDGPLAAGELSLDTAHALEIAGPWGQGFPEPLFENEFEVIEMRPVGSDGSHIKYRLRGESGVFGAIDFGGAVRAVERGTVRVAYLPTVNHYQGRESLDLRITFLGRAS